MDAETRQAHLRLHNQTLLDAWQARTKLYVKARVIFTGDTNRWAEGHKRYDESHKLWIDAVHAEFGPGCTVAWSDQDSTCRLGCGEVYTTEWSEALIMESTTEE